MSPVVGAVETVYGVGCCMAALVYVRVPAGTETVRIDWDRELQRVIGTAGGDSW